MIRRSIFATPVWQEQLSQVDNDELIKTAYALRDADPTGLKASNAFGYHSSVSSEIPLLQDHIINRAKMIVSEYKYEQTPYIQGAWFNIGNRFSINKQHYHSGAFLSGVYHLKATEHSGALRFHRNSAEAFIIQSVSAATETNDLNSPAAAVAATAGQLLIFPAWLLHSVDANNDDEDRISIAFNIGLS